MKKIYETVLTINKFWRWFTVDLNVHCVRRVFFLTLSGISCVTILKYTLILSPQFTRKYRKQNKQPKRKLVRQIILEINLALSQSELTQIWFIYNLILTLRWRNGLAHMTADNNIVRSIFYSYLFQYSMEKQTIYLIIHNSSNTVHITI